MRRIACDADCDHVGVIDESDLRIDTYRGSGAGSASWGVRVTHIPSGTQADTGWRAAEGDVSAAMADARKQLMAEIEAKLGSSPGGP